MTTDPLISVIMPAFNAGAHIDEAIRSLRTQEYGRLEIIVIDDGSTDSTRHIALSHASEDARVRVIMRAVPSGHPSKARNTGVLEATGEYIAFLDADDISAPDRFSWTVRALRVTGANVVFGDLERLYQDERGREVPSVLAQRRFLELAKAYLTPVEGPIYQCSSAFRDFMLAEYEAMNIDTVLFARSLLDPRAPCFVESLVCAEDIDLLFRLAESGTIAYVDRVFTQYRIHGASLTRTRPARTIFDGAFVRWDHLRRLGATLTRAQRLAVRRRLAAGFADAGYGFWAAGDGALARNALTRSLCARPTTAAMWLLVKSFVPRRALVNVRYRLLRTSAGRRIPAKP